MLVLRISSNCPVNGRKKKLKREGVDWEANLGLGKVEPIVRYKSKRSGLLQIEIEIELTRSERVVSSSQFVPMSVCLFEASELLAEDGVESDTDATALWFAHFVDAGRVQVDVVGMLVNGLHLIDHLNSRDDNDAFQHLMSCRGNRSVTRRKQAEVNNERAKVDVLT